MSNRRFCSFLVALASMAFVSVVASDVVAKPETEPPRAQGDQPKELPPRAPKKKSSAGEGERGEAPKSPPPKETPKETPKEAPKEAPKEPPKEAPKEPLRVDAVVALGKPRLKGGEIPLLTKMLEKTTAAVQRCVNDHGGVTVERGELQLRMLVRVRGRAEGVEVSKRRGIGKKAARCARKALKNKWVGTPSQEPVQVTFSYRVERAPDRARR